VELAVDVGQSNEEKFNAVFDFLNECSYVPGEQDPHQIFEVGGDCQAFSIYLKKEMDRLRVLCGIIPRESHMYNWVVLHNRLWKVDLTSGEVSVLSVADREKVLEFFPELREFG